MTEGPENFQEYLVAERTTPCNIPRETSKLHNVVDKLASAVCSIRETSNSKQYAKFCELPSENPTEMMPPLPDLMRFKPIALCVALIFISPVLNQSLSSA